MDFPGDPADEIIAATSLVEIWRIKCVLCIDGKHRDFLLRIRTYDIIGEHGKSSVFIKVWNFYSVTLLGMHFARFLS
jgi:hypothetical protein